MTRKKVTLAYITNDAARKATFKKRKKGLMKKVNELSTLCGIEACAIIYSPYQAEPEVWPSPIGARRTIVRFKNMSEMDQSKRMVNQQSFIRQRILKAEEQLKKQNRENREKEITVVMYRALVGEGLHNLNIMDLNDLGWMVDKTVKEIEERIKKLKKAASSSDHPKPVAVSAPASTLADAVDQKTVKSMEENNVEAPKSAFDQVMGMEAMQNQPWYMDLLKPATNESTTSFSRLNEATLSYPYGNNSSISWPNFYFQ